MVKLLKELRSERAKASIQKYWQRPVTKFTAVAWGHNVMLASRLYKVYGDFVLHFYLSLEQKQNMILHCPRVSVTD